MTDLIDRFEKILSVTNTTTDKRQRWRNLKKIQKTARRIRAVLKKMKPSGN